MIRSHIIGRRSSTRQAPRTSPKAYRPTLFGLRPSLERLEVRTLLTIAGGSSEALWLAQFSGMPGDTRASQIADAQQLLSGEQNVQVVDSVGVPGVVILQTPESTDLPSLEAELTQVPGFEQVVPYDPSNPASSAIQFPVGPAFENASASTQSTLAPAVSTTMASTATLASTTSSPAASPTSSVLAINGFDGMNSQVSQFIGWPDTTGAAGPSSYIEAVNRAVQISNKDGTVAAPGMQFSDFFSSLGNTQQFYNPLVAYNEVTQRFFIGVIDDGPRFSSSSFDVAISKSADPATLTSSDWNFYRYNTNDLSSGFDLALSPALGYNAEGYVLTFNEYNHGQYYDHSAVLAIRNDGSTSTGNQAVAVPGGFGNYSLAPARMHDLPSSPDQPMWLVETPGSAYNLSDYQITVAELENPFSSPTWTFTNINVTPFLSNPSRDGGITDVNTRMTLSALRTVDGVTHLVAADSVGHQDGGQGIQTKVSWYDVNVTDASSPSLYQEGLIDPGPGIDTSFPAGDIAPSGAIGMTYLQSPPDTDPRAGTMDMYVTGRLPTDPLGTMEPPVAAKLGTAPLDTYGDAGDYSSTTVDPSDGTFWSANEYSSASLTFPNWATWIQHFAVGKFEVTSSSPANGSTVSTSPSSYVVSFSAPVDPASLVASDLTVDGHRATAVTLSADQETATFTFAVNPAPNQGLHTISIAAGTITEQGDPNVSNLAYTADFRYDAIIIAPIATRPPTPDGVFVLPGPLTYEITFNEPVDPASVKTSDLILSGIPGATVTGATVLWDGTTVRFTLGGITSEGRLSIAYLAGAFTDRYGNPGPGFSASYIVEFGTVAFPTPLAPVGKTGSLIYQGSQSGILQVDGHKDNFTLPVNPGQTITLLLTTSPSLEGTLSVSAGWDTVATASASAPGQDVLIQTIKVPGQLGDGGWPSTYTFSVGGAGGTLGNYTLEVLLNAALESESVGGPSDNTTATAQDLTNSFVLLHGAGDGGNNDWGDNEGDNGDGSDQQPARAAVLGSLTGPAMQATVPESLQNVDTNWGNSFPFVLQPWGDSSMRYQQIYSASEMAGGGVIDQIRFRRAEFSPPFPDFQANVTVLIGYAAVTYGNASYEFASNLGAGVITAYNGPLTIPGGGSGSPTNPFNIVVNLASDFTYDPTKGDLIVEIDVHSSSAAVRSFFSSTNPNTYEPTTRIWATSDTATQGNVGDGYGLVTQFGYVPDSVDNYKIRVDAGQSVTVAATSLGGASVQVALLDSNGNTLALGVPSPNGNVATISDFLATVSGTYYLQMTSTGITQYSLVVTRNAELDAQSNHSLATAQDLVSPEVAGRRWVLGAIQPSQSDFYAITAQDDEAIQVEADVPGESWGQFADNLVPALFLYDAAGNLVASEDGGRSDWDSGGRAELSYHVPDGQAGTYYIEVAASTATAAPTSGEYVLSVKGAVGALPAPDVVTAVSASAPPPSAASDLSFQDEQWLANLKDEALAVSALPGDGSTPVGKTAL